MRLLAMQMPCRLVFLHGTFSGVQIVIGFIGLLAPEEIRTPDPQIRSLALIVSRPLLNPEPAQRLPREGDISVIAKSAPGRTLVR
jgi:hypothetical protein